MGRLLQIKVPTLLKSAHGKHHAAANEKHTQTREKCDCFRYKSKELLHVPHVLDKVLIKQQKTGIKPPFDPKPYTVILVNDTQVTMIRGSKKRSET